MSRIDFFIILTLSVFVYVAANETYNRDALKHIIERRETLLAAEAVRNITIRTPECRVQIANMATDFVESLNVALYALSVAVPTSPDGQINYHMAHAISVFSNITHDIQLALLGDSDQLKEKLATSLEIIHPLAKEHSPEFLLAENAFFENQFTRLHDVFIFGTNKLKIRAQLFEKTLKKLESETIKYLNTVLEISGGLKTDSKVAEEVLRRHFRNVALIAAQNVYRLENWIEVNPKSTENVKAVREVSEEISALYHKLISAADAMHTTSHMKDTFLEVHDTVTKRVKQITQLDFSKDIGVQEFIRSFIFTIITAGHVYTENVSAVTGSR